MHEVRPGRGLITLLGVAVAAALLVSLSDQFSRGRIADNERRYLLRQLEEVVSADQYDNDLAGSRIQIPGVALLGNAEPTDVHVGTLGGELSVFLFMVTAPDGYNGPIGLLVGIDRNGIISGVRVMSHRETPGLGDAIEIDRSDWILGFAGRSLANTPAAGWGVRIDGGQFDQLTGATITARAVVKAVGNTLVYFDSQEDELLGASPETTREQP